MAFDSADPVSASLTSRWGEWDLDPGILEPTVDGSHETVGGPAGQSWP
jgi:hypothetical protein